MIKFVLALLAAGALAGCAIAPQPSPADQAEADSCTAQADAVYDANNADQFSRTQQTGLLFSQTPNHVFDSQRLGSLHVRDSQITACEQNGAANGDDGLAAAVPVPPRIISTP